jgi:TusA-related sulfurtransferase
MESFDLRGTIIPFSLLQITNRFQQMEVGEEIDVFGNDAGIARDLTIILPASEAMIRAVETFKKGSPPFRWRIKKRSRYRLTEKEDYHV